MSSTESWFGNLRKIEFSPSDLTWGDKLRVLMDEGWKIDVDGCEENQYIEEGDPIWKNETRPFLQVLNGDIYEIFEYTRVCDEEYHGMDVWDNGNNTLRFSGSFYNGGTNLSELLENAIKDVKPSKVLYSKEFCGEELGEMGNDLYFNLHECTEYIPTDNGIPNGKFTLTLTWVDDND
jgi:hypothetical protein